MNISFNKTVGFLLLTIVLLACNNSDQKNIEFTQLEKEWLKDNPTITFAVDNTYPPLNFVDQNGNLTGLNVELTKLVGEKMGIEIILEGSDWNQALEKAMNHQVDGIINASPLEERKTKLNFSDELFQDPLALVCHESKMISSFTDITNEKIAAKKNSKHLQLVLQEISPDNVVIITTLNEGIHLLSEHKIDGIFDDLAPLYHIISESNFNNLKVGFVQMNNEGAKIGVRNDDPMLLSVLNKAINSITKSEAQQIRNKWLEFVPEKDYTIYYIIIGVLFSIVLLIGLWSWSLRTLVRKRTNELNKELSVRRLTEKELIKAKTKAEESDKLKSAFLANISHEIRTPMNGILGFAELLKIPDISIEEKEAYVALIEESSKRMLKTITDLINISRIESGEIDIKKENILLKDLMINVFNDFNQTRNENIDFRIKVPKNGEKFYAIADKNKLIQIITRLTNNALKFTEKGFVELGFECHNSEVEIYIKDSGIGISKDHQQVIFDRFRQADLIAANANDGVGLGLAISKAYVEAMGGVISVESEPGSGSEFSFTLPMTH